MGKIRADAFKLLADQCLVTHVVDSHLPSAVTLAENLGSEASSDLASILATNTNIEVVWYIFLI
jgi:hypothetical protein